MTELSPDLPVADYAAFKDAHPDMAAALEEQVKAAVQDAEAKLGPQQGANKQATALQTLADAIYDGVDLFAGFPGPVDALVHQVITPALPGLIDGIVAWFNESGLFGKAD